MLFCFSSATDAGFLWRLLLGWVLPLQAAKAVAAVGSTGPADDGSSDELPPLPAWQQQALAALQLAGPGANTEVTIRWQPATGAGSSGGKAAAAEGPVDPRLLAGVRVLCAPTAAALGGKSGVEQLGRWDAPIALAAELAALRTLTGMCAIALSQFKGTLEDDQALLAAAEAAAAAGTAGEEQPLSADQQLAVQFRMGKKHLLLEALSVISRRIKQLASSASSAGGTASGGGSKQGAGGGSGAGGKGKVVPSKKGGRGFGQ